jgi:hypothetical protein|tara:strand:- start:24 stop:224 length:201 start_codon:yes stop_codon:yes gene_type:complete
MTNKEYKRRINVVEFKLHGTDQEQAFSEIEKERMKSLEENLDIEWVKSMDDGSYDDELESEYGNLF